MKTTIVCWIAGLLVAASLGHLATWPFSEKLHAQINQDMGTQGGTRGKGRSFWIPDLMGVSERISLAILIGIGAPDVLSAAVTWMLVKLAAGWQLQSALAGPEGLVEARSRAFSGLLGSMLSLWCGALGGLIVCLPQHLRGPS